jgi:hypothetical protein
MSDQIIEAILSKMTPEQKADLLKSLAGSLEAYGLNEEQPKKEEAVKETVSLSPRRRVNEDFTVTISSNELDRGRVPVRAKKNQWVDEGENRDPDFNAEKFERMGKAARNRSKVKKRSIECHVCGRSFDVNPNLVYGEYIRCNRCTGR